MSSRTTDKDGWDDSGSDQYVEEFLYHLEADPYELTNLIHDRSYQKIKEDLQERLLKRMVEVGEARPTIIQATRER
ncbi:hypothetical protein JOD43_002283 [Pullulanibacillus pueri]|uniref:N-sulphoglucosamine sulphohydrolase C-terminal domain-containing protein n=1 Tax=Pullulanibacillus pueri TaxID=1437324 RepID=A0A8J2ZVR2_9BACL|nr:hypothetical protein [Pullulanibacillus pueri]MBM7682110.1 hypothetical protein [Pullulanibacillus pueri]GGH79941.1 hypothetical protein GCM10007096_15610 [Pullulanibacillus pueri]